MDIFSALISMLISFTFIFLTALFVSRRRKKPHTHRAQKKEKIVLVLLAEHLVPHGVEAIRIDRYLASVSEFSAFINSRSAAYKKIKRQEISINGEAVDTARYVTPGMVIKIFDKPAKRPTYEMKFDVIFEDKHLALIHKPAGIAVSGNRLRTVTNALMGNLTAASSGFLPRPVHRLDLQTEGLLVCAKTPASCTNLMKQFENKNVKKTYRAIVLGKLEGEGVVDYALDGKASRTRWKSIECSRSLRTDWITTVICYPETGRTHQIRRHMKHIGHPIVGDPIYSENHLRKKGLFLCAQEITFDHPVSGGRLQFSLKEPHKFDAFRMRESKRFIKLQSS